MSILLVSVVNDQLVLFSLKDISGHEPHKTNMVFAPFVKPGKILAAILDVHVEYGYLRLRMPLTYGLGHPHGIGATHLGAETMLELVVAAPHTLDKGDCFWDLPVRRAQNLALLS